MSWQRSVHKVHLAKRVLSIHHDHLTHSHTPCTFDYTRTPWSTDRIVEHSLVSNSHATSTGDIIRLHQDRCTPIAHLLLADSRATSIDRASTKTTTHALRNLDQPTSHQSLTDVYATLAHRNHTPSLTDSHATSVDSGIHQNHSHSARS